jgi:hypothetical protein
MDWDDLKEPDCSSASGSGIRAELPDAQEPHERITSGPNIATVTAGEKAFYEPDDVAGVADEPLVIALQLPARVESSDICSPHSPSPRLSVELNLQGKKLLERFHESVSASDTAASTPAGSLYIRPVYPESNDRQDATVHYLRQCSPQNLEDHGSLDRMRGNKALVPCLSSSRPTSPGGP